ncbi:hypothetical protein F4808DRAFT_444119 [Astrocystis sublimbata]|nr:hypothetical protein F4808DRAFT_444119 [Astrocystis sublimbata]
MDLKACALGLRAPTFIEPHHSQEIWETLYRDGVVFIQNCNEESLVHVSKSLGVPVGPRNAKSEGSFVSNIRCAPDLVGKGYSSEELFFHTDRSGWDLPPRILATTVAKPATSGGESLFVDGEKVLKYLRVHEPLLYTLVTSPQYSSFKADDGTFIPRAMIDEARGILRFRFDDGIQLSATFIENFSRLKAIIYEHAFGVALKPGQGYIVDNHRFLHGRTAFTGERAILRVLAYPHRHAAGSEDYYGPGIPKKFVLFDIDGTLCRAEALSIDAFYKCLSDVAGIEITEENTKVNLHGQTDLSLVRDILEYHGVSKDCIGSLTQRFLSAHPSYIRESAKKGFKSEPCPGASDMLSWLGSIQKEDPTMRGSMGLLTGNSKPAALLKITEAGLPVDFFDLGFSSFGDACPSRAALFHDSLRGIETKYCFPLNSEDVLLIGDTPLDIDCAKKAGCRVLAVTTGNYDAVALESHGPDFLCNSLPEGKQFLGKFLEVSLYQSLT